MIAMAGRGLSMPLPASIDNEIIIIDWRIK